MTQQERFSLALEMAKGARDEDIDTCGNGWRGCNRELGFIFLEEMLKSNSHLNFTFSVVPSTQKVEVVDWNRL